MSSGPPRRNEKPRSASSSCIEDTPTSITTPSTALDALRGANLGEIGKAVLDQRQPAARPIDQIEPARDRRAVAVDADDAGPGECRGSPGCSRRRRRWRRHRCRRRGGAASRRLAAEHGNMTLAGRIHAPAPGSGPGWNSGNWTRTGPLRLKSLGLAGLFAAKSARSRNGLGSARCRSRVAPIANPDFPTEFAGLPWDFERQTGPRPSPKTGSALHHLVTAVSVKKALMGLIQLPAARRAVDRRPASASDASRTHSAKMRSGGGLARLRRRPA